MGKLQERGNRRLVVEIQEITETSVREHKDISRSAISQLSTRAENGKDRQIFFKVFRVILLMDQVVMHYITATSIQNSRYITNKCCTYALSMSGTSSPACTIYLLGLQHLEPCLKEKSEQNNCIQSNCNQSCSVELNTLFFFSH